MEQFLHLMNITTISYQCDTTSTRGRKTAEIERNRRCSKTRCSRRKGPSRTEISIAEMSVLGVGCPWRSLKRTQECRLPHKVCCLEILKAVWV